MAVTSVGASPVNSWNPGLSVKVVSQLAIRVLFIVANIAMATLFPPAWHWLVVPIVSVGATAMAALFFPQHRTVLSRPFQPLAPEGFPRDVPLWPAHYPDLSPVGYRNESNDCAFNAIAHFVDSDPIMAEWVRHPIQAMNVEEFCAFLGTYLVPDEWIVQFRTFAEGHLQPAPLFPAFLDQYQPQEGERQQVRELKDRFKALLQAHEALAQFYQANDAARAERHRVSEANPSSLRRALNRVSAQIDPNPRVQTDASEILGVICNLLPPGQWPQVQTQYHLRTEGLPLLTQGENLPRQSSSPLLQLHFPSGSSQMTLENLIQRFQNRQTSSGEGASYRGIDGQMHQYPIEREENSFLTAPESLRFQLVRMSFERPPESGLNRWLPRLCPRSPSRGVKNDTRVQMPDEIGIRLATGEECRYRLRSFVTHDGDYGGGHYTSGEIRGEHRFIEDDSRVTLVEGLAHQDRWRSNLEQAYLVCYVRVR